ncbi:glycosyltransferase family 4 protein [Leptolyngbya sp. BC1307]|uniref:glycosyltransferase family 4 protein n=1 Tax=Leptolyngbya sp. BC1307 TaxID=2029589 RepID=UPI000EFC77A3|nr:glycosyltransferase family 4 protein [Leptolyngbya sp. BC1307]
MDQSHQPVIALLPWGDVIEDYLDSIDISMESFCAEMTGGWLFGYVEALKLVGVRTVIICMSRHVEKTTRRSHHPSGSTILILPTSYAYKISRRLIKYADSTSQSSFLTRGLRHPFIQLLLKGVETYSATPVRLLKQAIEQENCQAILCQEYEYPRFDACILVGKWLELPVYASFQGGNFQANRMEGMIRPRTIQSCAGLIVATETEIRRVRETYGLAPEKIVKIFNPLDLNLWKAVDSPDRLNQLRHQTRRELGIPVEATLVMCHGRIDVYRKGLDILMEAWGRVCNNLAEQPYLLIVGTGDDANALQAIIDEQALQNIIWINKYILDRDLMIRYLLAADIYTLSSRHEGFPVAPLEAMACGLPIIATEVPGIPDILDKHEESGGIRVPCKNAAQLALAIECLVEDKDLRQQMGQWARQRVESHFSLLSVGQQLKAFMLAERT